MNEDQKITAKKIMAKLDTVNAKSRDFNKKFYIAATYYYKALDYPKWS